MTDHLGRSMLALFLRTEHSARFHPGFVGTTLACEGHTPSRLKVSGLGVQALRLLAGAKSLGTRKCKNWKNKTSIPRGAQKAPK